MEEYKRQAEDNARRRQNEAAMWMQVAGGLQQIAQSLPQKGGASGASGFGGGAAGATQKGPNPACSACQCPSPGANDHHGAYCAMTCQCRCKLNAGGCGGVFSSLTVRVFITQVCKLHLPGRAHP